MPIAITAGAEKLPKDATGVFTSTAKETGTTSTGKNAAPAVTGNAVLDGAAAVIGALAL